MPTPSASASPTQLLSIAIADDRSLMILVSPWILASAILLGLVFFVFRSRYAFRRARTFELDRADIGIGSGTLSFKGNVADQQIAYAIWVELSTRKIGLPIDLEHDVVWEIYESWHTFFSVTRELIKDVPVSKLRNDSTKKIILLSIDVLNRGLRPHLTFWHARFRRWYDIQLKTADADVDPQSLQAKYPRFSELRDNLLEVNNKLIRYRQKMAELVLDVPNDAEPSAR